MVVRMCIACRERDDKENLIRIVVENGILLEDKEKLLPGRGMHIHDKHSCILKFPVKERIEKALRAKIKEEPLNFFRAELLQRSFRIV